MAEPLPVAEGISTFDIGRGKVLTDIGSLPPRQVFTVCVDDTHRHRRNAVRLDTMVTVVDAHNFLLDYQTKEGVLDRYAHAHAHTHVRI